MISTFFYINRKSRREKIFEKYIVYILSSLKCPVKFLYDVLRTYNNAIIKLTS